MHLTALRRCTVRFHKHSQTLSFLQHQKSLIIMNSLTALQHQSTFTACSITGAEKPLQRALKRLYGAIKPVAPYQQQKNYKWPLRPKALTAKIGFAADWVFCNRFFSFKLNVSIYRKYEKHCLGFFCNTTNVEIL